MAAELSLDSREPIQVAMDWRHSTRARVLASAIVWSMLAVGPCADLVQAYGAHQGRVCSLHGPSCTCAKACSRDEDEHRQFEPQSDPTVPARHRNSKSAEPKTQMCSIRGCAREPDAPTLRSFEQLSLEPRAPKAARADAPLSRFRADQARVFGARGESPPNPPPRS